MGVLTRTLTVNYLECMAIRAAMSVSQLLSVIWSLETCCRIHSKDNLLTASQALSSLLSCVHCQTILLSLIIHLDGIVFFLLPGVVLLHQ